MSFESLTFQLPIPDRSLSPNARVHWAVKSKAVKAARIEAKAEALRVLGGNPAPRWQRARVVSRLFLLKGKIRPDPDNFIATLKAYIDGLASAGIVENDRELWPERPEFLTTPKLPRVEITITPETK